MGVEVVTSSIGSAVLVGLVRFLGATEALSFRDVRPCVREVFSDRSA